MSDQVKNVLEALLALSTGQRFNAGERCQAVVERIAQEPKGFPDVQGLNNWLRDTFGDVDFITVLRLLGSLRVASMAMSMSSHEDPKGFWRAVNKDKAKDLASGTIANLLPYMYTAYLNSGLQKKGLLPLQTYKKDIKFVSEFASRAVDDAAQFMSEMQAESNVSQSPDYALNLLFVNEFLHQGVPTLVGKTETSPAFPKVVTAWAKSVLDSSHANSKPKDINIDKLLTGLVSAVAHITAPTNTLNAQPHELLQAIGNTDSNRELFRRVQNTIQDQSNAASDQKQGRGWYKTIGQEMFYHWGRCYDIFFAEPARKAIDGHRIGLVSSFPLLGGLVDYTGDEARQFIEDHLDSGLFDRQIFESIKSQMNHTPIPNDIVFSVPSFPTPWRTATSTPIFKAGFTGSTTLLTCHSGATKPKYEAVSFDKIRSSTSIITLAQIDSAGGTASAAIYPVLAKGIELFGFNGSESFFTSDTIFQTTTGLRAVDPAKVRSFNPWLEIGSLDPGHVVLRYNGSSYDFVTIDNLEAAFIGKETALYSINVEKANSYHADGYLLFDSRPHEEFNKTAAALKQLSPEGQIQLLSGCQELKPLFARYGAATVMQALEQQISQPISPTMQLDLATTTSDFTHPPYYLLDHDWHWYLQSGDESPDEPGQPPFPRLSAYQGVLFVDGSYCHQAQVDPKQNTLAWSREIAADQFEHGFCLLHDDFHTGEGFTFVSTEANPTSLPSAADRSWFRMETDFGHLGDSGPMMGFADEPQAWTLPPVSGPTGTSDLEVVSRPTLFKREAATTTKPVDKPFKFYWDLDYDTHEWAFTGSGDEIVPSPNATTSKPLFRIQSIIRGVDGTYGYTIPLLDNLWLKLDAKSHDELGTPLGSLPPLYTVVKGGNGLTAEGVAINIRLDYPDLIASAADNFEAVADPGLVAPTQHDLTFTKLDIKESLPILFTTMTFMIGSSADITAGLLRVFAPTVEGCAGARFTCAGKKETTVEVKPSARQAIVAATTPKDILAHSTQTQLGIDTAQAFRIATNAHAQPAAAVRLSNRAASIVDSENALSMADFKQIQADNGKVRDIAQMFIQNAMLYHMDSDALEKMMRKTKPTAQDVTQMTTTADSLPLQMADKLEESLKVWLKETFGRAYVGRMLSNADVEVTKELKEASRITGKEAKRLRYWWDGKGKSCLASSIEYTKLNEIATKCAMLQMNNKTKLQQFINEDARLRATPNFNKADLWAQRYFALQSISKKAGETSYVTELQTDTNTDPATTGYTETQKICNILQVLEPLTSVPASNDKVAESDKPLSVQFANIMLLKSLESAAGKPYVGPEAAMEHEYDFLPDAMKQLCEALMNDKQGVQNEMTKSLRAELKEVIDKLNEEGQKEATRDARAKILAPGEAMQTMMNQFGFLKHFKDSWKAIARTEIAGEGVFARSMRAGKEAVGTFSGTVKDPMSAMGKFSKGVMLPLMIMAGFGFGLYMTVQHWGKLTGYDKMKFIVGSAQGLVEILGSVKSVFTAMTLEISINKATATRWARILGATVTRRAMTAEIARPLMIHGITEGLPEGLTERRTFKARRNTVKVSSSRGLPPPASPEAARTQARRGGILLKEEPRKPATGYAVWGRFMTVTCFVLSACMLIASIWELNEEYWHKNTTGKALSVVSVILQGLAVLAEGFVLAASFGYFAAIGAVCAWLGPVLVLIGIVFVLVNLFTQSNESKERGETSLEKYLRETLKPSLDKLPEPPTSAFGWTQSPGSAKVGDKVVYTFTGVSPGTVEATNGLMLRRITVEFTAGTSGNVLFQGSDATSETYAQVSDQAATPNERQFRVQNPDQSTPDHSIYPAPAAGDTQRGVGENPKWIRSWELQLCATPTGNGTKNLLITKSAKLTIEIGGKIGGEKGSFIGKITESWYDATPEKATLQRESIETLFEIKKQA